MKRLHSLPWLAAAALALTLPLTAVAADETQPAPETPEVTAPAPASPAFGLPGLKVGKDPKTGHLRKPTQAEDLQMALKMQEFWLSFPRHEAKVDRRTGKASMVVAPHAITMSIATRGADGKVTWDCVESPTQIPAMLETLRERGAGPEEK